MRLEAPCELRPNQAGSISPTFHPPTPQRRRWAVASLLALAALTFGSASARADFVFTLDTGNPAISGYTGPYVTVDVKLTSSTTANITFTSQTHNGDIYLMGGGQAFDLNVNASSFTVGAVTETNSGTGFTPGPTQGTPGPNNADGFGMFNLTIDNFDGFTHSASSASFTLTNTSGKWGSANAVLTANANGALAAAHIFVTTDPANQANSALATGYAAGSGTGTPPIHNTPAPSAVILLASGAICIAGFKALSRRRRQAA